MLILAMFVALLCCVLAQSIAAPPAQALQRAVLKPGDRFRIEGAPDPALCGVFSLDANGECEVPFLGLVVLGGLNGDDAAKELRHALESAFGTAPQGIRVVLVGKVARTVRVEGAVRWSLEWPWGQDLTLESVLQVAEPTDAADLASVRVVRADGVETKLDARSAASRSSFRLAPGDRVEVPPFVRPPIVVVLGAVRKPGDLPFRDGLSARAAIQAAGGLTGNADRRAVKLERDREVIDTINLELGYDAALRPGDVVRVPMVANPRWVHVVGAAQRPGRVDYHDGMTLREALELAGGARQEGDAKRAVLSRRVGGQLRRTTLNVDGPGADYRLNPNDVIEIPFRTSNPNRMESKSSLGVSDS